MGFKRSKRDSDEDINFKPPKRLRLELSVNVQRALSLLPSSPPPAPSLPPSPPPAPASLLPSSPPAPGAPDSDIDYDAPMPDAEQPPLPALFPHLQNNPLLQTPQPLGPRAQSVEPRASSPMSAVDITPLRPKRGRPAHTPNTRNLKQTIRKFSSSQRSPDQQKYTEASAELGRKVDEKKRVAKERSDKVERDKRLAEEQAMRDATERQATADAENTRRAQMVFELITASEADGGFNFASLEQFFDALWRPGGDATISSKITRYINRHGADHATGMFRRSNGAKDDFISSMLAAIFQREGRAIQGILTRDSTTSVTELLKEFSMDQLALEIRAAAPTLWAALAVLATPDASTRREADGESRRNKPLVFTTICALISVLRSQRANNFQLVIGLFLLGSGASKREISVLAHAGLSVGYQTIIDQVKKLSQEGMANIRELVKSCMVQIVWDNLNIAFRVAAQRLKAKNHFDNGTTATILPVFDPDTGGHAAHGTLPLEMKPLRERTLPVLDWTSDDVLPSPERATQLSDSCFWQLKHMALEHIPGVLPELKKQLRECPEVNQIPLHKTPQYPMPAMKLDESTLDGTSEVRETIFHSIGMGDEEIKAHGLVGEDGDLLTDGLKDKPLAAGWGGKKATEWQPAHELIHISLPAHIVDGFRIYCGHDDLEEWAKSATFSQFEAVAKTVFEELFSTAAVNKLRARQIMPRYADAMFETLVRIKSFPPKLRQLYLANWLVNITGRLFGFKPVDLLQEHQNYWAKIIYAAKGTNKSWKWLSMITVCIFTIREAMRTVQTAFEIPAYGVKHKTPPINKEVAVIAAALEAEKIHSFVPDRPANDHIAPVRDLIKEGALYANTRKAFHRFTRDTRKPERRGFDRPEGGEQNTGDDDEEEGDSDLEHYEPTEDDLRVDNEEFLMEPGAILASAMELMDGADLDVED
ncbi:hypothetical protein B0H17DRAFT_1216237 [Mycena rosella]|uniref:DUF6589 domain-containing protein n=1 Tax=Mycena rosella TaxID=1033263 RepID=A0AAD7FXN7_MYCRO|nr:hypothetical protein B0H17DRAFT_1216237 [Mycena rosella]